MSLARTRTGTALVTGSAGFIGSHLCERLIGSGWQVRGVDALTDYYDPTLKRANLRRLQRCQRFSHHEIDLASDPLDTHVAGADVIFHLAGQPGVRSSFGHEFDVYVQRNLLATQRLLEASAERPPRAFVYASSSSVYGDADAFPTSETTTCRPISPYGMTKLGTEELAATYFRTAGVPTVGLRYFTVYGPRQRPDMAFCRFVTAALSGEPVTVFGDGKQIRDFTYVADVVDATIAAAMRGVAGSVYNVGGGSPVTLNEVLLLLERLIGAPLAQNREGKIRGDVRRTVADTTRARREIGFRPRWDIGHGLAVQVQHALREGQAQTAIASRAGLGSGPTFSPGASLS